MRAPLVKFLIGAAVFAAACAAALLPVLVPPRSEGLAAPERSAAPYDGYLCAVVQGDGVARPGSYRIPYGTTYGELFALAGYAGASAYPKDEAVRYGEDAVLGSDGIWRIYIVV